MRRNTYAAATTIGSCFFHFSFTIIAMAIDEPHMRKLTLPVALSVRHTHIRAHHHSRSQRTRRSSFGLGIECHSVHLYVLLLAMLMALRPVTPAP